MDDEAIVRLFVTMLFSNAAARPVTSAAEGSQTP